jgi:ribosome-associated protein
VISGFADYFVVCHGDSAPQILAISEEIEARLKKAGAVPLHSEGSTGSGWMLLDYGYLVIHVFSQTMREYYQLEKLWEQANTIIRIQ